MNGYPRDMFEGMDEIFSSLLSRMEQEMSAGNRPFTGYRIVMRSTGHPLSEPDLSSVQPRIAANPVAEVHRIDDEVKVITELPGAAKESIRIDLKASTLVISADSGNGPYQATAGLPEVDAGSMQSTFRNGVLEVTFRTLPEKTHP